MKILAISIRLIEIIFKSGRHPFKVFKIVRAFRKISITDKNDSAIFLREFCESLGPVFIKFGQILSTRSDLLPGIFIENLSKLQDSVSFGSNVDIRMILKKYFKERYDNIFSKINTIPAHSASICLIFEGILRTGDQIIIKLKRPDVEKIIINDFNIFEMFAFCFQNKLRKSGFKYPDSIIRIKSQILKELDFIKEIENAKNFSRIFAGDENIKIPKVYDEYSCNDFIIMEKIDGTKIDSLEFSCYTSKKELLKSGARAFLKQIFISGIFHADPHPGNIFFTNDNKIALIDFGNVGKLNKTQQNSLLIISVAILNKDLKLLFNVLKNEQIINEKTDMNDFIECVDLCLNKFIDLPLKEISASKLFSAIFNVIRKFQIQLPSELLEVFRCLIILDGVGKKTSPDFNIIDELKPAIIEIMIHKYPEFLKF